jgi:hypothetical protein
MAQTRFIVNRTFTDKDGNEYAQGAIYEVDEETKPKLAQWMEEGKVRDPDNGDDNGQEGEGEEDEEDDEEGDEEDHL